MIKIDLKKRGCIIKTAVFTKWLVPLLLLIGSLCANVSAANAETRSLRLHFVHTGERAEIVFKRNGRYDSSGLKRINEILRDWRRNEPTRMDPRLLDLLWEAYRASGSREYIHVVSAYRSPATNSMLRSRSKGVAEKSQHMLGKAIDFYLPDVKLKKLREIGLKMQGGGVGYYPGSGSPFVHFDVGNVRHWPKMSRKELVALFPSGKTLHVPSDGKPLPGFDQAVAAYEARRKAGGTAIALAGSSSKSRGGGLLAALFGRSVDEEEESGGSAVVVATSTGNKGRNVQPARKAVVEARSARPAGGDGKIRIIPPELAPPAAIPAQVEQPKETIVAALPNRDAPLPVAAPRPSAAVGEVNVPDDDPIGQLAMAAPFPSTRPEYRQPPGATVDEVARLAEGEYKTVGEALASVSGDETLASVSGGEALASVSGGEAQAMASQPVMPTPSRRPDDAVAVGMAEAPPSALPALPETVAYAPLRRDPVQLAAASLSEADDVASIRSVNQAPQQPESIEAVLRNDIAGNGERPGAVSSQSVRTTPKAARPDAQDSKASPRPVVVAALPQAARWALDSNYVANNSDGAKAPSYANKIVYSAPREVYTIGFQRGDLQGQANRFSGKAVTFLSVARFN